MCNSVASKRDTSSRHAAPVAPICLWGEVAWRSRATYIEPPQAREIAAHGSSIGLSNASPVTDCWDRDR